MGCGGSKAEAVEAPSRLSAEATPELPRRASDSSLAQAAEDVDKLASERHVSVAALPHVPPAIFLAAVFNDVAFFKSLPVVQLRLECEQIQRWKALNKSEAGVEPPRSAPSSPRPTSPSSQVEGPKSVDALLSRTDRHGFNVLQLAAVAGSADVLELLLDVHTRPDRLRVERSRHGGLLHYSVTGRKAIADFFNAVRMNLLHNPRLDPAKYSESSLGSLGDAIRHGSTDSLEEAACASVAAGGGGGGVGVVALKPYSSGVSQKQLNRHLNAPVEDRETPCPAIVPGLVGYKPSEAEAAKEAELVEKQLLKRKSSRSMLEGPGIALGGLRPSSSKASLATLASVPEDEAAATLGGGAPLSAPTTPSGVVLVAAPAAHAQVGLDVAGALGGGAKPKRALSRSASLGSFPAGQKPPLPGGGDPDGPPMLVETEKCTEEEEEFHDPLHIHGIDYLRGLLKYSPRRASGAAGPHAAAFPRVAAEGGEHGGEALKIIQEIITHQKHVDDLRAHQVVHPAAESEPLPTTDGGSSGGGSAGGGGGGGSGGREGLARIRASSGGLSSGLDSHGSLSRLSDLSSSASEEEDFENHMAAVVRDHTMTFHKLGLGLGGKSSQLFKALKADSLVGSAELHIGHGEGDTLPYLDARVNLTREEKQIEDINDIPWLQRFPRRSKVKTVEVLLKHFPPRKGVPHDKGLQFKNSFDTEPLGMAMHAKEQKEDPDDVLAMVRHVQTHVLHEEPWHSAAGSVGRGLLETAVDAIHEWEEIVTLLERAAKDSSPKDAGSDDAPKPPGRVGSPKSPKTV